MKSLRIAARRRALTLGLVLTTGAVFSMAAAAQDRLRVSGTGSGTGGMLKTAPVVRARPKVSARRRAPIRRDFIGLGPVLVGSAVDEPLQLRSRIRHETAAA